MQKNDESRSSDISSKKNYLERFFSYIRFKIVFFFSFCRKAPLNKIKFIFIFRVLVFLEGEHNQFTENFFLDQIFVN
jgi:hypothetical protein